jgi:predicted transcriptional regulator
MQPKAAQLGQPPILAGCKVIPPIEATGQDGLFTDDRKQPKRKPDKRKTGNRFAVLNAFVDCTAGGLSRGEILVWLVLYRDVRNGIAETSQANIARRIRRTDRTVRRIIGKLEQRGLLKKVYRGGLSRGASKYQVFPLEPTDSQRT